MTSQFVDGCLDVKSKELKLRLGIRVFNFRLFFSLDIFHIKSSYIFVSQHKSISPIRLTSYSADLYSTMKGELYGKMASDQMTLGEDVQKSTYFTTYVP